MRGYRKILGIISLIITIVLMIAFLYAISQAHFTNNYFFVFLMILMALGIYITFHFVLINKVGFYKTDEPKTKANFLILYLPISILVIFLGIIGIKFIEDTSKDKKSVVTESQTNTKESIYNTREKIISDTTLDLVEKFKKVELGKFNKHASVIEFSIEKVLPEKETFEEKDAHKNIKSLNEFFKFFKLKKSSIDSYDYRRFEIKGNAMVLKLSNGRERIEIVNRNSNNYIGFLENQNVFLFEHNITEEDCDYISINGLNGEEFNGIPLFGNKGSDIYADVHFTKSEIGGDLNIRFWYRDEKSYYDQILFEKIPMNYYFGNSINFPFKIDDVYWDDSTFHFVVSTIMNGKEDSVHVTARVIIQG